MDMKRKNACTANLPGSLRGLRVGADEAKEGRGGPLGAPRSAAGAALALERAEEAAHELAARLAADRAKD